MKLTKRQRRYIDPIRETAICPFPVKSFTVSEYQKLLKVGILVSGDPYELLNGWIIPKLRRSPRNASCCSRLASRLFHLEKDGTWFASQCCQITCSTSEPEPSNAIVLGTINDYSRRHPRPREIATVMEVSDDSLVRDRGIKLEIYARGKIPVYWIINLIERHVEVYAIPKGGKKPGYAKRTDHKPGDDVPVIVAGRKRGMIPVAELLPST